MVVRTGSTLLKMTVGVKVYDLVSVSPFCSELMAYQVGLERPVVYLSKEYLDAKTEYI